MLKKFQVFVSSTFRDLADERQDAIKNVLDLGHIPAGMEMFPAADTSQLDYIKKVIAECDYYLLIIGGRYGSTDVKGVSFTEREYDYAYGTGKTVLAFVNEDFASIPVGKTDNDPALTLKLQAFRDKVMRGRLVKLWTNRQQLEGLVLKGLVNAFNSQPAVGWVRADVVASEELLSQINVLRLENEQLRANASSENLSQLPSVEGLADFDDEITVSASYFSYSHSVTFSKNFTLTWGGVFQAVGPILINVVTHDEMGNALSSYIRHVRNEKDDYSVSMHDVHVIQNQLQALGYIEFVRADGKAVKNSGFTLTGGGSRELMHLMVVKK